MSHGGCGLFTGATAFFCSTSNLSKSLSKSLSKFLEGVIGRSNRWSNLSKSLSKFLDYLGRDRGTV